MLRAGAWFGEQLLVSWGVDGCNCLCKAGGPVGWMEPRCFTAGVEDGVRAGSQALRRPDNNTSSKSSVCQVCGGGSSIAVYHTQV